MTGMRLLFVLALLCTPGIVAADSEPHRPLTVREQAEALARAASERFNHLLEERNDAPSAQPSAADASAAQTPTAETEATPLAPVWDWLARSAKAYDGVVIAQLKTGEGLNVLASRVGAPASALPAVATAQASGEQSPELRGWGGFVESVRDWLARANRSYRNEIVKLLRTVPNGAAPTGPGEAKSAPSQLAAVPPSVNAGAASTPAKEDAKAEDARRTEAKSQAEAVEKQRAEEEAASRKRLAEQHERAQKQADEERQRIAEAVEARRRAEAEARAKEVADAAEARGQAYAESAARSAAEAEEKRAAEEKRLAQEKREAEEKQRVKEERLAEEKRRAAEEKRLAQEAKRQAEEADAAERRAVAEAEAETKRKAEIEAEANRRQEAAARAKGIESGRLARADQVAPAPAPSTPSQPQAGRERSYTAPSAPAVDLSPVPPKSEAPRIAPSAPVTSENSGVALPTRRGESDRARRPLSPEKEKEASPKAREGAIAADVAPPAVKKKQRKGAVAKLSPGKKKAHAYRKRARYAQLPAKLHRHPQRLRRHHAAPTDVRHMMRRCDCPCGSVYARPRKHSRVVWHSGAPSKVKVKKHHRAKTFGPQRPRTSHWHKRHYIR